MPRQNPKPADPSRTSDDQPEAGSGDWYGGERENEFGGEGRFRAGGGHGSHFGGKPDTTDKSPPPKPDHRGKKQR